MSLKVQGGEFDNDFEQGVQHEGLHNAVVAEVRLDEEGMYGPQIAIHFQIEEEHPNGRRKDVMSYFGWYDGKCMGTTDNPTKLRTTVQDIIGAKIPQEKLTGENAFDLGKLVGTPCQIVVKNKTSKKGNVYAKAESFLKAGDVKLEIDNYEPWSEKPWNKNRESTPAPVVSAPSDTPDELPWD